MQNGKRPGNNGQGSGWNLPILLSAACAIVLLVPFVLILALHLPPVQKSLLSAVIKRVEKEAKIRVQYGDYRWSPFSGLRLTGLEAQSGGEKFFETAQLDLTYDFTAHPPYIKPEMLDLQKPYIRLEKDASGHWTIPKGKEAPAPPSPETAPGKPRPPREPFWLKYPLPRVMVNSATIEGFQDGQPVLKLNNVTGELAFKVVQGPGGPRLTIDLGRWRGQAVLPEWGAWEIAGSGSVNPERLVLDELILDVAEKARLCLAGEVPLRSSGNGASLEVRIEPLHWAAFPELASVFPQLEQVAGLLHIRREKEVWFVEHRLTSNLGNIEGMMQLANPADGNGEEPALWWSTRFDELTVPGSIPDRVPRNRFKGKLELALRGNDLETMRGRARSWIEPSSWGKETIRGGEVEGSYDSGVITLKKADIESSLGSFRIAGMCDLNGFWDPRHEGEIQFRLTAEKAKLEDLFAKADHQIQGVAACRLRYPPGQLHDWKKWNGNADIRLAAPQFLSVNANGDFKAESLDIKYSLDVESLQKLSDILPDRQGRGTIRSRGTIQGKWPEMTWKGSIDARKFQYEQVHVEQAAIEGTGMLAGREAGRKVTVKAQGLSFAGKKVRTLSAELEQRDNNLRFQIHSDGPMNDGSVHLAGSLEGIWNFPRVITLGKSGIDWRGARYSLDGKLRLDENSFGVDSLAISRGKQRIRAAGAVSYTGKAAIEAVIENIQVEEWLDVLGSKNLLSGSMDGKVRIAGIPERLELSWEAHLANAVVNGKEPLSRVQMQGTYAGNMMQVEGNLAARAIETPARISAKIPLHLSLKPFRCEVRRDEAVVSSLKASGFHLEYLLPYAPFLSKLEGRIDVDAEVAGTLSQPKVRASGSLHDGTLQLKAWPHPMRNVELSLEADAGQVCIRSGKADILGGKADLTGEMDYKFEQIRLEASGRDIQFPELYGIAGNGLVKVQLTCVDKKNPLIAGRVDFSRAQMSLAALRTNLARDIQIIEGKEEEKPGIVKIKGEGERENPFYSKLRIDLDLRLPPSGTWVRGEGVDAEMTGAMQIKKESFGPLRLVGEFQTLRGTYMFQDTRLNITEGHLVFTGAPNPDPELRVTGQKEVANVTIIANVSGPLSRPKLALGSIPAMDQVDILSYAFFGRSAGKLDAHEGSALQGRAALWLGSKASGFMKTMLGKMPLAPDVVRLHPTETGTRGVVEVGKYLTPDLYVTYEKGIERQLDDQVRVEYRVNRHVSVQSQVGPERQTGVDVFWQFDFGD